MTPSNVEVRLVDKPADPSIFVSLDRVQPCYPELGDISWFGKVTCKGQNKAGQVVAANKGNQGQVRRAGPVTRSQTRQAQSKLNLNELSTKVLCVSSNVYAYCFVIFMVIMLNFICVCLWVCSENLWKLCFFVYVF